MLKCIAKIFVLLDILEGIVITSSESRQTGPGTDSSCISLDSLRATDRRGQGRKGQMHML